MTETTPLLSTRFIAGSPTLCGLKISKHSVHKLHRDKPGNANLPIGAFSPPIGRLAFPGKRHAARYTGLLRCLRETGCAVPNRRTVGTNQTVRFQGTFRMWEL